MEEKEGSSRDRCAEENWALDGAFGDTRIDRNLGATWAATDGVTAFSSRAFCARVLVWDRRRSRRDVLDRTLVECGLTPRWIDCDNSLSRAASCGTCGVAIVALGHQPTDDAAAYNAILALKNAGSCVVAYGHKVQTWSLGMRGKALLAGATCILDSAQAEFLQKLQLKLVALCEQKTHALAQIHRTRSMMRSFGIIGESEASFSLFERILRIAPLSDLPVLITGESGTGKEIVAQAIHRLDPKRCNSPLIPVNCGAISATLAESELFGHKKGAFTGADRERKGLFPSAHGGVLFLDEIGELRSDLQAKLLRVLQEHAVLSVGSDNEAPVNFRVIAATNRNLPEMVRRNEFRADLFHRLNVLTLRIPPLRERKADLRPLAEALLHRYQAILPGGPTAIEENLIETLALLELPGNVRELESILLRALVNKAGANSLDSDDLPLDIWKEFPEDSAANPLTVASEIKSATTRSQMEPDEFFQMLFRRMKAQAWTLRQTIDYCERLFLEEVLHQTQGNQSQAAKLLGITARSIYSKVKEYHLESKPKN